MEDQERNGSDFCDLQFQALRGEILGIKERVVKHQLIGITGIPLIIGAGQKYDLSAILVVSPLITLAFSLMLVFEQSSLMRAGEYIKKSGGRLAQYCASDKLRPQIRTTATAGDVIQRAYQSDDSCSRR